MVDVNMLINNNKQKWELGIERIHTRFLHKGISVGSKQEDFITIRNNGDIFRNNYVNERLSISGLYNDIVGEFTKMFKVDHVLLGLSVDEVGNVRKGDKLVYSRMEQGIENLIPMGYRGRFGEEGRNIPIYRVGYFAEMSKVKIMLNKEFPEEYLLGTFTPTTVDLIRVEFNNIRETLTKEQLASNPQLEVNLDMSDNAIPTPERSKELGIKNISIVSSTNNYEALDINNLVKRFLQRLQKAWGNVQLEEDMYIRDLEFESNYLTSREELAEIYKDYTDIDLDDENLHMLEIISTNKQTKESKRLYITHGMLSLYMENDSPESLLLDIFNQFLNNYGVQTEFSYQKQEKLTNLDIT